MVWFVGATLRVVGMSGHIFFMGGIEAYAFFVVEERRACHYGTPQAPQFRHMEKADDVPEVQGFTSLRRALAWRLIVTLTLGAPLSYMKRIINVVCDPHETKTMHSIISHRTDQMVSVRHDGVHS